MEVEPREDDVAHVLAELDDATVLERLQDGREAVVELTGAGRTGQAGRKDATIDTAGAAVGLPRNGDHGRQVPCARIERRNARILDDPLVLKEAQDEAQKTHRFAFAQWVPQRVQMRYRL